MAIFNSYVKLPEGTNYVKYQPMRLLIPERDTGIFNRIDVESSWINIYITDHHEAWSIEIQRKTRETQRLSLLM